MPTNKKDLNGYTNKEMLGLIIQRLEKLEERIDEIIDEKVSRFEMYSVISALLAVGALVGYLSM
tara:strand:+ start:1110 stop:1301 length:192 start_codon:yes stop_codon:yes gene_type:complete